MKSSRTTLSVAALVALAAWANVQAMACCWAPDAVSAARAVAGAEPMAADHSCCSGAGAAEASDSEGTGASSGCGMDAQGFTSPCCETGETAAVAASAATADAPLGTLVLTANLLAVATATSPPVDLLSSPPPDGSPPYLSFQRLLI